MLLYRRPTPGRYNTEIIYKSLGGIGGTNFLGGASPLTANATTTFYLGSFHRVCAFLRFSVVALTVPVDADGTILARLMVVATDGTTRRQVSEDINLEALTAKASTKSDRKAGISDAANTLKVGETLEVDVVNNTASIDTQPAQLVFTVECALIS